MFCKKCEAQIVEDSDFCPEYRATQNSNSSHVIDITLTTKKSFYKKWWVWAIAGTGVIICIAAFFSYRKDKILYKRALDLFS